MTEGTDQSRERGAETADARALLAPRQHRAAMQVVRRVRREVPAMLVGAYLFGSQARREARADSDVDVLLVFRRLPPDREPHATHSERIAERVGAATGVPVEVWSVSLPDLECGVRTPMLVDALRDAVPLWPAGPVPRVPFTPRDALWCVDRLLDRVDEGAEELAGHARAGRRGAAAARVRDDLVRLLTAAILLTGETEPRRAEAVRRYRDLLHGRGYGPPLDAALLRWAERSYGDDGRDEERPVAPPPGGIAAAAAGVEELRRWVADGARRLRRDGPTSASWTP